MDSEVTEYERLRKVNIEKNSQKLSDLGLLELAAQLTNLRHRRDVDSLRKPPTFKQTGREDYCNTKIRRSTRANKGKAIATLYETRDTNSSEDELEERSFEEDRPKAKTSEEQRSHPRLWSRSKGRKGKIMSTKKVALAQDLEEENVLSQDTDNSLMEKEFEEESEDHVYEEGNEGDASEDLRTNVVDELELREVNILKRMAQSGANPRQVREKMQKLGQRVGQESRNDQGSISRLKQSKVEHAKTNVQKVDQRDWVEVDNVGRPVGIHRAHWMTKLRGYSRDLDWSVDDFNSHPRSVLNAIKEKLASVFEYRGGSGYVPDDVFFRILRQQMKTRRANIKKCLEQEVPLPSYVKEPHLKNFKELIQTTEKREYSERMRAARQTMRNVSGDGHSEDEVKARLTKELGRAPTELEVEDELAATEKSVQNRSSSSKGMVASSRTKGKGLEEVRNDFYDFKNSVNGQLSDMSALMKELISEVRFRSVGGMQQSMSQLGKKGHEDGTHEEGMEKLQTVFTQDAMNLGEEVHCNMAKKVASEVVVEDATQKSDQGDGENNKLEKTEQKKSTTQIEDVAEEEVPGGNGKKEKKNVKKRKGEAEKLLIDATARNKCTSSTEEKGSHEKETKARGCKALPFQIDCEDPEEEPTRRRGAMRVAKGKNLSKKMKNPSKSMRCPPVRISEDSRTKVLVLNVNNFLCDIRPLHDNREWGMDGPIHYDREFNVKIKKRKDCTMFLKMLHSRFDVGIWAPIGEALLQVVAKFLAAGTNMKWCFLWGRETGGGKRDLNNLFSVISDPSHGPARVLQVDCDSMATSASPASNVLNIAPWDPVDEKDNFIQTLMDPFQSFSRNPSDVEYCITFLDKAVYGAQQAVPATIEGTAQTTHVPMNSKKVAPMALTKGSKVKVFGVEDEKKDDRNVLAHGEIVNVAGATLHGRIIEEGNVSITIMSIVPGAEGTLLYEANEEDLPPLIRLGDALKSITKWPLEALAPSSE